MPEGPSNAPACCAMNGNTACTANIADMADPIPREGLRELAEIDAPRLGVNTASPQLTVNMPIPNNSRLGDRPAISRPVPTKPRVAAKMAGRNAVVSSIDALISFPLVGQLAQIDWRAPFFLHLLGLIVVPMARKLPAWRLEPHIVAQRQRTPERGLGAPVAIVAMAAFVGLAMYVGPMFSPFYLATIGITDPRLAALPLSAMSVGSFLMTTSYGRIHARLGTGRTSVAGLQPAARQDPSFLR